MLLLLAILIIGLAVVVGSSAAQCGTDYTAYGPAGSTPIPSQLIPIYEQAAAKYNLGPEGWAYLAAINKVETDFGRNMSTSSAGAIGWMQFEPGTWQRYGQSVNHGGPPDPYDPWDAIFAAADYLSASGAPGDWPAAIYSYNHAGWYVDEVTQLARQYLGVGSTASVSATPPTQGTPQTSSAPQTIAQYIAAHHLDASFAEADQTGRLVADYHGSEPFHSASITKAMVLVAVLQRYAQQQLPASVKALLAPMIVNSDDAAANAAFKLTTSAAVERVAADAGMSSFQLRTSNALYVLGDSLVDADDQARFFARIDQLLPANTRSWALGLLSHPHAGDWGIVSAVQDGTVYSKAGWQPVHGQGDWTVVQSAQIVNTTTAGLAILTQRDPSMQAGIQAIDAIAQLALAPAADPPASTPCQNTTLASGPVYLTPGAQAVILPNGQASIPAQAPAQVQAAIAAGNEIIGKPYLYGGGHGQSLTTIAASYDCSSAVSFLLHGGGLLSAQPEDSTELESYGSPGPGNWVSVYANAEHTFVAIAGLEFDTSPSGNPQTWQPPGSGPRWRPNPTGNLHDGLIYVVRHPPGL